MNKKIITLAVIILLGITSFFVSKLNAPAEIHTVGPHAALLDAKMNGDKMVAYCSDHGLDYTKIRIYEVDFSVFNNGYAYPNVSLPVFDPRTIKNILGVYSSFPLNLKQTVGSDPYRLQVDPLWLKKQSIGDFKKTLKVKYLMQIGDFQVLPITDLISEVSSQDLIQQVASNSNLNSAKQMADKIRSTMPLKSQDNLSELIKTYCLWIKKNISYPVETDMNIARKLGYINISNSHNTLETRIGVCEDDANLLRDLLNSQGIETHLVPSKFPKNFIHQSFFPDNFSRHEVVLVKTSVGYFLVDPTIQDINKSMDMTLSNGQMIKVSSHEQDDTLESAPIYIDSIGSLELKASCLSFKEIGIKYIRY